MRRATIDLMIKKKSAEGCSPAWHSSKKTQGDYITERN